MKAKHIFGVLVRLVGLLTVIVGLYQSLELFDIPIGIILGDTRTFDFSQWKTYFAQVGWHSLLWLLLGLYLLRGAPHVIRFAYRDDNVDA